MNKIKFLFLLTILLYGNGPIEHKPFCEFTEIKYSYFTVCFNEDWKVPQWVYYELTKEEVENKKAKRYNTFLFENRILSSSSKDYLHSGYDRGHLAPAADMSFSKLAMKESFYMTNIAPQIPEFNRKYWLQLENYTREKAIKHESILVYTGAFTLHTPINKLNDRVAVPHYFYKMLKYDNICEVFIMPNYNSKPFTEHRNDCDFIEYILNFKGE